MPLTAIIPTFNEEKDIRKALESVRFADEILVVDSFSTDATLAIAKEFGARIIQREYGYSASQKNWAIPQASHEWILLLDADEWLEEYSVAEIQSLLATKPPHDAYWLPRENHFMGKKMRFGLWKNDKVIRLFRRDLCAYEDKRVHAEIKCAGSVGHLTVPIQHNTYKGFSAMIRKTDRYTTWAAADRVNKKKVGAFDVVVKPWFAFFRDYFLKLGFLDGLPGFISAAHTSWSKFIRAVKIYRMQAGEVFFDPQTGNKVFPS
jgi:glycosyltransferase involved in cell wall biosynthesis